MKEILIIAARVLMLAILVALIAFYSFVFWHWRNDAKRQDVLRASLANATSSDSTAALRQDPSPTAVM
jgi:hypothetical protein